MMEIVCVQVVSADLQEHTHVHLGVRTRVCVVPDLVFLGSQIQCLLFIPSQVSVNPGEQARAGS